MIGLTTEGPLWTITLNRPDKAGALTRAMLAELLRIAGDARGKAQAVILTGTGPVFSAGADLAELPGIATDPLWNQLSTALATLPCLTIAALNGTLAGGAFGMALACDLRLATAGAKFFYPVMRLGVLPQPGDPARLAALIGPARAKLLLMAGHKASATEALDLGLIDRIAAPDSLLAEARSLTADACAAAPAHLGAIKAMLAQPMPA